MYVHSMTKSEFAAFLKATVAEAIRSHKASFDELFPKTENDYCTIKTVIERFKVSEATVHNWAKRNTIKKYKINGRTLYKVAEIEKVFL